MINKKEDFIKKITKLTEDEKIKWELYEGKDYYQYIYNPSRVVKIFKSIYNENDILLIEKKVDVLNIFGYKDYEKPYISLFSISKNGLVLEIDENNASIELLEKLITLVDSISSNNYIDNFFNDEDK